MTRQPLFHEIVERHGATVLRVCAATLGPGADAEDAWSETYLAALRAHPADDVENIEAWLVRIARHKSIDVLRARARATPAEPDPPHGGYAARDSEAFGADPSTWDDELWAHVAQLSERQQFVVAHRFIGQWTYPEIAEKLGCTPAAARRCGADALAALRRRMAATADG